MSKVEFTATQRDNHIMKHHNFEAIIFEKMLQQVHPLRKCSNKFIPSENAPTSSSPQKMLQQVHPLKISGKVIT